MLKPNRRLAAHKSPPDETTDRGLTRRLDLTALRQTPGFMIRILQIQIFEEFFEYFSAVGLSPAEHSSLITIRDNPSVSPSEIASVLRIQLPNLVNILLKLETRGLIKRKRSNRDKRAVELMLTSSGEKAAAQASKMADAFNALMLSPLSENEQKQFLGMLGRLVHAQANKPDPDA
jgi:DNA-binding MarR family transcriptional regulator